MWHISRPAGAISPFNCLLEAPVTVNNFVFLARDGFTMA
jgi:hypothetical protein